jgi:hypothetical protein
MPQPSRASWTEVTGSDFRHPDINYLIPLTLRCQTFFYVSDILLNLSASDRKAQQVTGTLAPEGVGGYEARAGLPLDTCPEAPADAPEARPTTKMPEICMRGLSMLAGHCGRFSGHTLGA